MDRAGRGGRGDRRGVAGVGPLLTDLLAFLQDLPPGLLYTLIGVLAALENVFPFVPADSTVAVGAFLAGRGTLHAGVVFCLTWGCNVAGGGRVLVGPALRSRLRHPPRGSAAAAGAGARADRGAVPPS